MLKWLAATAMALATVGPVTAQGTAQTSLYRLDCGTGLIKDFNAFFSDTLEYKSGPREIVDSCYLIRRGNRYLLWDTGFPAALKGNSRDMGPLVASLGPTIKDQLAILKVRPEQIDFVGISHMHGDHTGQAAEFPGAELILGKGDFERSAGKDDPFAPWRRDGAKVRLATGDVDVFGDGSVIAMHTPGHTPNHLVLLVKLASGPVLLSGDLYHATEARAMKGVPPFNTSRAETLASMDRFERLARQLKAKVIIQHEPADVAKLPVFPKGAE